MLVCLVTFVSWIFPLRGVPATTSKMPLLHAGIRMLSAIADAMEKIETMIPVKIAILLAAFTL
jgi:hypothetical protein